MKRDYQSVQALRGIAALLVVLYHAVDAWASRIAPSAVQPWPNGSAGVDVFFVISGLVMVLSSARLAGRADAAWAFIRGRVRRIVPLYWLITTAKILLLLAVPAVALRVDLSPGVVVLSYLLLPLHDAAGNFAPVVPVGWTLTYECFFYLLVAAALWRRVPIPAVALPVLLAVVVGAAFHVEFANAIVAEFLFGVALGRAVLAGWKLRPSGATIALVGGFCLLLTLPVASGLVRPVVWGLPALLIVAGAVSLEDWLAPRLPHWLLAAGAGSYAIYLTHGFVVPVVLRAVMWLDSGLWLMATASLLLAGMFGWLVHRLIERPVLLKVRAAPPIARMV